MKIVRELTKVLLALIGWACLIFAGVVYGIKCFALMALALIVSALLGGLIQM